MRNFNDVHVCAFLLVFLHAQTVLALWTYRVNWPEGEVTSYTYPRTAHGDCLYDRHRGRLICMRDHGYQNVVNTWLYDSELIVYVSVRCLVPHPYPHHLDPLAPTCICTGQHEATTQASQGVSSLHADSLYRCQLEQLSPAMLDELDQLQVLDLSHNLLQRLPSLVFASLRALKVLSLASNPLRRLLEGLVCPLESLEVLDLKHMQLTTFPGHVFRCDGNDSMTSSVRWLDVSGNHVSEMPAASLWYLSRLVFLNVSDNLLHRLPAYPLLGAPSLTTLSLARNLLHTMPDFFCEGAPVLQRLSLHSNMFTSLALASLDTCQNLTHLDLTDNILSSLPAPPASLPHLQHLRLSRNRLTTLSSPLLAGSSSMITLDLSHNDLRMVSTSALGTMAMLVHLDLHDNALSESTLDLSGGFVNLTRLQTLDLSRNQFTSVTEDDFEGLTSLQTLDLSQNGIKRVTFASQTSLIWLTHLNLSTNLLTSLSPNVILPLTSLRVLDVSRNLLHHVTSLHVPATLLSMDLSCNSLQRFPRLPQAKHLHQLDLSFNRITHIGELDLQDLSELSQLSLARNSLSSIHTLALAPLHRLRSLQLAHNRLALNGSVSGRLFAGLRQLKKLNLSYNHLFDAKVLFQSESLTSLVDLDVSYNSIGRISQQLNQLNRTMHLEHLNLKGCRLREISAHAFSNLIYLRSVNLQHNRLTHLPLFRTHPGIKYHLRGNPITCDCYMSWLKYDLVRVLDQTVSTRDYDVNTCRTLPRGHLRSVRDISRRDFLCVISSARCPPSCTCYSQREASDPEVIFCAGGIRAIPSRLPVTTRVLSVEGGWLGDVEVFGDGNEQLLMIEELYLNNSGITSLSPFIFDRLPNLLLLHLDHNHLEEVHPQLFAQQFNLTSLILSHNRLMELPAELLSKVKELRLLDLSHNSLTTLSMDTVEELTDLQFLQQLQLADNPWKCNCDNVHLYRWLRENMSRVPDYSEMLCESDLNHWFLLAEEGHFDCTDDDGLPTWVVGVLFISLPLLIVLAGLVYRFRRVLAAVLYARLGLQCLKPHSDYVPLGRLYDASVLYDHSDRKCRWWVDQILLPRLTSPTWRLRVHVPRAGPTVTGDSSVMDNAVYSVRQSAVCVVLVSKHFGAHQHTVNCLAQVLQQAQTRSSSLVLITWGELTKQTLECGIRPFLGKGQHLPITAPFFWDRLLYLLPSPHPAATQQRKHSLTSACRFRSLSDLSTASDDKMETQGTEVTQHV